MMFPIDYNGDVLNHNARVGVDGGIVESTDFLADFSEQTKRVNMPLLLDIYPNAAAAYSLRKLRTAYTGSAIRVRRSSDNTETDIGFNNAGDLDTSALMAFVGNGNGFVSTWYDQSGNNRNATQIDTIRQPQIMNNGVVNQEKNKPTVNFTSQNLNIPTSVVINETSWFITGKSSTVGTTSAGLINYQSLSPLDDPEIRYGVGDAIRIYYNGGYVVNQNFSPIITQNLTTLTINNSKNTSLWVNSSFVASSGITGSFSSTVREFTIGKYDAVSGYRDGSLQEFIIYTTDRTANRIGIETNINSYYRIYQQEALLLDYYPDAAAAYSLRKLRSGYTGAAIQVRRSSDNAVQNIGFDSNGGLDTTALTTFVGTGNTGFVTTWYDQSLNGNNVTQTGTTAQPVIFSGGTVLTQNSKPSISFDGVNDFLTGGDVLRLNNFNIFTIYSTRDYTKTQLIQNKGLGGAYVGTFAVNIVSSQARTYRAINTTTETFASSPYILNNNVLYLHVGSYNKVNITSSLNNSRGTNTATGDTGVSTEPYVIGKLAQLSTDTYCLNGSVSEIINYGFKQETSVENNIAFNINSYYNIYPTDSDANAFVTAAGLTGTTQIQAVNKLVTDLKGYGLWGKMKAIYPFVGGTASSHKFNLKDPRDVDGAFRLVFNGGWTHSATGALPNGTTGWARPFLIPSVNLINANFSISYYSRTNILSNTIEMGCGDIEGFFSPHLRLRFGVDKARFICGNTVDYGLPEINNNDSRGYFIGTITSTSNRRFYKNSSLIQNNTSTITNSLFSGELLIAAYNSSTSNINASFFSNKECAFATIGDGLTDTEAANLYTAVQAFQTTLGRQV